MCKTCFTQLRVFWLILLVLLMEKSLLCNENEVEFPYGGQCHCKPGYIRQRSTVECIAEKSVLLQEDGYLAFVFNKKLEKDFLIAFWFKAVYNKDIIVFFEQESGMNFSYSFLSSTYEFQRTYENSTQTYVSSTTDTQLNKWTHIVIFHELSTFQIRMFEETNKIFEDQLLEDLEDIFLSENELRIGRGVGLMKQFRVHKSIGWIDDGIPLLMNYYVPYGRELYFMDVSLSESYGDFLYDESGIAYKVYELSEAASWIEDNPQRCDMNYYIYEESSSSYCREIKYYQARIEQGTGLHIPLDTYNLSNNNYYAIKFWINIDDISINDERMSIFYHENFFKMEYDTQQKLFYFNTEGTDPLFEDFESNGNYEPNTWHSIFIPVEFSICLTANDIIDFDVLMSIPHGMKKGRFHLFNWERKSESAGFSGYIRDFSLFDPQLTTGGYFEHYEYISLATYTTTFLYYSFAESNLPYLGNINKFFFFNYLNESGSPITYEASPEELLTCVDSYYNRNENICQYGKIPGCLVYSSVDYCFKCDEKYELFPLYGDCVCENFHIAFQVGDEPMCFYCDDSCLSCTGPFTTDCTSCKDSFEMKDDGSCGCSTGESVYEEKCQIICGDGLRHITEECDDGNIADSDGCTSACIIESGYRCARESESSADVCWCHPKLNSAAYSSDWSSIDFTFDDIITISSFDCRKLLKNDTSVFGMVALCSLNENILTLELSIGANYFPAEDSVVLKEDMILYEDSTCTGIEYSIKPENGTDYYPSISLVEPSSSYFSNQTIKIETENIDSGHTLFQQVELQWRCTEMSPSNDTHQKQINTLLSSINTSVTFLPHTFLEGYQYKITAECTNFLKLTATDSVSIVIESELVNPSIVIVKDERLDYDNLPTTGNVILGVKIQNWDLISDTSDLEILWSSSDANLKDRNLFLTPVMNQNIIVLNVSHLSDTLIQNGLEIKVLCKYDSTSISDAIWLSFADRITDQTSLLFGPELEIGNALETIYSFTPAYPFTENESLQIKYLVSFQKDFKTYGFLKNIISTTLDSTLETILPLGSPIYIKCIIQTDSTSWESSVIEISTQINSQMTHQQFLTLLEEGYHSDYNSIQTLPIYAMTVASILQRSIVSEQQASLFGEEFLISKLITNNIYILGLKNKFNEVKDSLNEYYLTNFIFAMNCIVPSLNSIEMDETKRMLQSSTVLSFLSEIIEEAHNNDYYEFLFSEDDKIASSLNPLLGISILNTSFNIIEQIQQISALATTTDLMDLRKRICYFSVYNDIPNQVSVVLESEHYRCTAQKMTLNNIQNTNYHYISANEVNQMIEGAQQISIEVQFKKDVYIQTNNQQFYNRHSTQLDSLSNSNENLNGVSAFLLINKYSEESKVEIDEMLGLRLTHFAELWFQFLNEEMPNEEFFLTQPLEYSFPVLGAEYYDDNVVCASFDETTNVWSQDCETSLKWWPEEVQLRETPSLAFVSPKRYITEAVSDEKRYVLCKCNTLKYVGIFEKQNSIFNEDQVNMWSPLLIWNFFSIPLILFGIFFGRRLDNIQKFNKYHYIQRKIASALLFKNPECFVDYIDSSKDLHNSALQQISAYFRPPIFYECSLSPIQNAIKDHIQRFKLCPRGLTPLSAIKSQPSAISIEDIVPSPALSDTLNSPALPGKYQGMSRNRNIQKLSSSTFSTFFSQANTNAAPTLLSPRDVNSQSMEKLNFNSHLFHKSRNNILPPLLSKEENLPQIVEYQESKKDESRFGPKSSNKNNNDLIQTEMTGFRTSKLQSIKSYSAPQIGAQSLKNIFLLLFKYTNGMLGIYLWYSVVFGRPLRSILYSLKISLNILICSYLAESAYFKENEFIGSVMQMVYIGIVCSFVFLIASRILLHNLEKRKKINEKRERVKLQFLELCATHDLQLNYFSKFEYNIILNNTQQLDSKNKSAQLYSPIAQSSSFSLFKDQPSVSPSLPSSSPISPPMSARTLINQNTDCNFDITIKGGGKSLTRLKRIMVLGQYFYLFAISVVIYALTVLQIAKYATEFSFDERLLMWVGFGVLLIQEIVVGAAMRSGILYLLVRMLQTLNYRVVKNSAKYQNQKENLDNKQQDLGQKKSDEFSQNLGIKSFQNGDLAKSPESQGNLKIPHKKSKEKMQVIVGSERKSIILLRIRKIGISIIEALLQLGGIDFY